MKLANVHIQNYRSILDSESFDVEVLKTILVGPNEAGKSAILQALQQINPPNGVKGFDSLRDYPRSRYNDITTGKVDPSQTPVVTAVFTLEEHEQEELPDAFKGCRYSFTRYLDNGFTHLMVGGPSVPLLSDIRSDLKRLDAHVKSQSGREDDSGCVSVHEIIDSLEERTRIKGDVADKINAWLKDVYPLVEEENSKEENRHARLIEQVTIAQRRDDVVGQVRQWLPVFVLYNNYFRVRPIIHLGRLAARVAAGSLDDEQYDYGNVCLLKLLGFSASELSKMGQVAELQTDDPDAAEQHRRPLDQRQYALNAASVRLTKEIRQIWNPDEGKGEAATLQLRPDGQYLKVVVVDDLGVEIELDQRSEGFQWLVSFFAVFFAEAEDEHENAILLLDEPGLSLHALKQREFRSTLTRLAENNQTIYTTHSPFLVGPDELDLVRVVEMENRTIGTKVHTSITANDPAALLPLQEALGYDLAQSLFTQKKNLVLEGLTDFWYIEAVAALLREAGVAYLDEKISLVPANTAGKVVYFATILHAQNLKVAALLDSDAAGDTAASQDTLVHILGQKRILRTKDFQPGSVKKCEVEDLLRDTLVVIAKDQLNIDVENEVKNQPSRPVVEIMSKADKNFSKYKLAKAFVRWSRDNTADALSAAERSCWPKLIGRINKALS